MRSSPAASSSIRRRQSCCGRTPAATTPTASSGASARRRRRTKEARAYRVRTATRRPSRRHRPRVRGRRLGPAPAPRVRRPVRHPLRRLRDQPALLRGPPRPARPERPLHARPRRHDLPDARPQGGAWHATIANGRSIGIEIANIGAYPVAGPDKLSKWYETDATGRVRVIIPGGEEEGKVLRPTGSPGRPAASPSSASSTARRCCQYDLTPQQYDALIRLTATLCKVFPRITCDYPRDESGRLIRAQAARTGLQELSRDPGPLPRPAEQDDPGPAFQWDRLIDESRRLMSR